MKLTRLLVLLIASLLATASLSAQQNPTASPSPAQETAEQKAAREKRLAERRAERRANDAKRATERRANEAKRAEERKARLSKEASEKQGRDLKRAAERKLQAERRAAERQAMAAKRAVAQKEATARRAAAAARRAADNEKRRALNDGTFRFLSSRMNSHFTRVVKGAPYSAVAVSEFVQKFVDGNQIVRRNEVAFYRDSEGRMRVEQKLNTIGKWQAAGDAPRIIMIGDPVSGEYYHLDPRNRTAVKNVRLGKRLQELKQKQDSAPAQSGTENADQKRIVSAASKVDTDGRRRTESLGSQRIEGVEAQGKRTTVTIPAGEIGNTLPIEITDESWYSTELQTLVMTKRRDPRSGETTYRLTNISRREPERSLFQVPADYTIVDKSAPKPTPKTKTETNKVSKSQIF